MLTNNACITLYHKVYDPALRGDTWKRTQFQGCNWYGCRAVTVGNNGLDAAGKQTNLYTCLLYTSLSYNQGGGAGRKYPPAADVSHADAEKSV